MGASGTGRTGWEARWQRFVEHVQSSPGRLVVPVRQEVFRLAREGAVLGVRLPKPRDESEDGPEDLPEGGEVRADVPEELAAFAARVAGRSQDVTDEEIAGLRDAGYSEDQIFEAVVVAAVGAAAARLDTAHRVMEGE